MCLTFDYMAAVQAARDAAANEAAAAGAAALEEPRTHADCNGIQITTILHKAENARSALRTTFCYMPLASRTAKIAMYPCLRKCAEHLLPCAPVPCKLSLLEAWFLPGERVPIPDRYVWEERPIYRSLGGGSDDDDGDKNAASAVPDVELPPSKCIKNLDGSCTFVLKTADFVKTDAEVDRAIAAKEYPDKATYLLALSKGAFKSLVEGMDANGVDKSKIFAMSADDENQVNPEAMIRFLDEFYPNLRAHNDMIVCIPGPNEDGELKMETAFSLCFHCPDGSDAFRDLPLLGLVHNIDDLSPDPDQEVESDYYITSNTQLSMTLPSATMADSTITLNRADEFLPYDQIPDSDSQMASLKDYPAWISGCERLQTKVQAAFWASISELCARMSLPDFDQEAFFSTNLVGRSFAKDATSSVLREDSPENLGSSVLRRMKTFREATAEKSRKHPRH